MTGTALRRVRLLVGHAPNRSVLRDWLGAQAGFVVGDGEPDIVIADGPGLAKGRDWLAAERRRIRPVFLPCVFVTPSSEVGMITGELWRVADEVVTTPIRPEELRVRIERLLATRELSLELEADAAELRRSNVDLERFASVVAHELRAPLAGVYGFVETLRARSRDALGDSAVLLDEAATACLRMRDLMENLIAYARTDGSRRNESVDLDEVVRTVLGDLRRPVDELQAEILVGPLPSVLGDGAQLGILFHNLIGNALKYRRPDTAPRIEVAAERHDPGWVVAVADNGVGIDEEIGGGVFEIFERGSRTVDRAGSGIGLAICRRIVENHGGRIWFDRRPTGGTTFRFQLPAHTQGTAGEAPRVGLEPTTL